MAHRGRKDVWSIFRAAPIQKDATRVESYTKELVQAGVYKLIAKDRKDEHEWVQDMTYDEIPAEYLRRTLWTESLKGRWRDPEDISVLEIRAVVKAVFDLLKFPHVHRRRLLYLGDNMGVVLSCARSRSRFVQVHSPVA